MGEGAKNRAMAQRTASEKDAGKYQQARSHLPSLPMFFTHFPNSRLSPLSECLEQARGVFKKFPPWWGYGHFLEPHNFTSRSFPISFLTDQMKGCMSNFQLLSRYLRQITRPDSAMCDQESTMRVHCVKNNLSIWKPD